MVDDLEAFRHILLSYPDLAFERLMPSRFSLLHFCCHFGEFGALRMLF